MEKRSKTINLGPFELVIEFTPKHSVEKSAYCDGQRHSLGMEVISEKIVMNWKKNGKHLFAGYEPKLISDEQRRRNNSINKESVYFSGTIYLKKETAEIIFEAIEELRKETVEETVEETKQFGWCDKCGSYCYGDCSS